MRITFFEIIGELERDGSCTTLRQGEGELLVTEEAPGGLAVRIGGETFHLAPSPRDATWEGWVNPATRRQRRVRFSALRRAGAGTADPRTGRIVLLEGTMARGEAIEELCPGPAALPPVTPALSGFARGTRILTAFGELAVEELRVGDLVHTVDEGLQPVLWIGRTRVSAARREAEGAAPVRLARNAFGAGLPSAELLLPPTLGLLVDATEGPRLAPAAALAEPAEGVNAAEFFHILFERHQLVYISGLAAESFHASPCALARLGTETRGEILAALPTLAQHPLGYGPPVRRMLSLDEARTRAA